MDQAASNSNEIEEPRGNMKDEMKVVNQIIKRYGSVIDLEKDPSVMIEILRKFTIFGSEPGTPDGGTPPTGPTSHQGRVTNEDLMKAILKLSRQVAAKRPRRK